MAGLVPAISKDVARHCRLYRDRRDKPGDDEVYSAAIPAVLATALHFADSATTNCPNSCGEPGLVVAPTLASRSRIASDRSPSLIAALSFSITAAGVPAGAMTPVQNVMMKSAMPLSTMVGT